MVSHEGHIWSISLGKGHNNDQGMLALSEITDILRKNGIKLLADRGYWNEVLVTPRMMERGEQNDLHKKYRCIVERIIGFAKTWMLAGGRCRLPPEMQELCLFIIYAFVNDYVRDYPIVKIK